MDSLECLCRLIYEFLKSFVCRCMYTYLYINLFVCIHRFKCNYRIFEQLYRYYFGSSIYNVRLFFQHPGPWVGKSCSKFMYIFLYVFASLCVYIYIYTYVYVYIYMYIYVCIYTYIHTYIDICMCICIHIKVTYESGSSMTLPQFLLPTPKVIKMYMHICT
jgi:hypothetical protein